MPWSHASWGFFVKTHKKRKPHIVFVSRAQYLFQTVTVLPYITMWHMMSNYAQPGIEKLVALYHLMLLSGAWLDAMTLWCSNLQLHKMNHKFSQKAAFVKRLTGSSRTEASGTSVAREAFAWINSESSSCSSAVPLGSRLHQFCKLFQGNSAITRCIDCLKELFHLPHVPWCSIPRKLFVVRISTSLPLTSSYFLSLPSWHNELLARGCTFAHIYKIL